MRILKTEIVIVDVADAASERETLTPRFLGVQKGVLELEVLQLGELVPRMDPVGGKVHNRDPLRRVRRRFNVGDSQEETRRGYPLAPLTKICVKISINYIQRERP